MNMGLQSIVNARGIANMYMVKEFYANWEPKVDYEREHEVKVRG